MGELYDMSSPNYPTTLYPTFTNSISQRNYIDNYNVTYRTEVDNKKRNKIYVDKALYKELEVFFLSY